jgi:hypothetical protein
LQELGRQSTERHDSEHRWAAVVANVPVSWRKEAKMGDVFALNSRLLLRSSILQVVEQQSTERHDSEHRGAAVVANAPVSWRSGDGCGCAGLNREIAVDFVDFAGRCFTID